jgi:hypothetical protein
MKAAQRKTLIDGLKARFTAHMHRHANVAWDAVEQRLHDHPESLDALAEMERTGGEPDVLGAADPEGAYLFCDCASETPQGRRSLCYDGAALQARKEAKPADSAVELATRMGITLTTEATYRLLQQTGEYDVKTSSWVATPPEVRALGGALFCDRRYGRVFVYHNGAQSYYSGRAFRGSLRV